MLRKWKSKNKYHQPVKNFNEAFQNRVRAKMASTVWRPIRGATASLGVIRAVLIDMAPFKGYSPWLFGARKISKTLALKNNLFGIFTDFLSFVLNSSSAWT